MLLCESVRKKGWVGQRNSLGKFTLKMLFEYLHGLVSSETFENVLVIFHGSNAIVLLLIFQGNIPGPAVIKKNFMLNSAKHEILNAHK